MKDQSTQMFEEKTKVSDFGQQVDIQPKDVEKTVIIERAVPTDT